MTVTIEDIRAAAATIGDRVERTPCVRSRTLSVITGAEIWLKFENLQYTASFKDRGALNKLAGLSADEKSRGVIACSAGNHAQGVAYHAQRLGIPATIVMPAATPFTKVRHTRAFGAEVVLTGEDLSAAQTVAEEIRAREGFVFIHPYDDDRIIAGQGTVGLEMLDAVPDLDCLVVPIGGGGLISGVAVAAKSLKPEIEIVGVEAALYPSMAQALAGETPTSGGQTIAEGIAVKRPGERTRAIIEELVSEILIADESALEEAVLLLMEVEKTVAEGAGAAALAAVSTNPERFRGRKVGLVVSGGNIDRRILASILMRGLVRDGRITRMRSTITDAPGTLAKVARIVGEVGGNIVEVLHQRMFYDVPVKQAELDIIVETRDSDHAEEIIAALRQAGFPTRELSDTTTADL